MNDAEYTEYPPGEQEGERLPEEENELVGAILCRSREMLGYDLDHVARILCVRGSFLRDIESGIYSEIPYADAYVLPFIRSYGEYLGLNEEDLNALCRKARNELAQIYPSLETLDLEDIKKVGEVPGDSKVSVWEKERFARRSSQHISRIWLGGGLVIVIVLALLTWRFYQIQIESQQEREMLRSAAQLSQSSVEDVISQPLIKIKSLDIASDVYIFGNNGVVYEGILEPGKSITLPQESDMRYSVSPSSGWELIINGKKVPQEIALSSSSLDEIADMVED